MTIKDIAAIAGVSATTVSMVLNNKADSISEETREKVLRVVKEYHFKPYARAMQNASSRSGLVGLVIPGELGDFSGFLAGAQEAASAEGYSLVLCQGRDAQETEKQLNSLFSRGVDGAALYLAQQTALESLFADAPERFSYAAATNLRAAAAQCAAYCAIDDAAQLATEHLIEAGHRQIALIGWRDHACAEELTAGYSQALYRHGITFRSEAVCLCGSAEELADEIRKMTYGNHTAFLCQDAQVAACVYRVLNGYGLQIPRDHSVVSLSEDGAAPEVFTPELTTVDVQRTALGRAAMLALIAKLEGVAKQTPEQPQLSPQLRPGGSVAPPGKAAQKRMIVVGSMNMDVIIHMSHLPAPGESLLARRIIHLPGGKGANQAVGAAKLGGNVYAIGCLGEDQEGRLLYNSLAENGVNTTGVRIIRNEPTGKAYILVAEQGESTFVLSHGANGALQPGMVQEHGEHFAHAAFCLLSTEIPWETVLATLDLCTRHHVKVIVKPTTETPIPDGVLEHITFLIPNEQELDVLVPGAMPVAEKAAHLFACGVENVIVTLGDQGCYLHNREMKRAFPAANFTAVDTTGAGDAFISAFAVALSEGNSIPAAIQFATYAAGISVTRDGVQPALAGRMALEMYADQYSAPWPERV